jgi:DNA-binding NtrC family response regulator
MTNDYLEVLNTQKIEEVTKAFQQTNASKLKVALIDDDEMCLRVAKHKLDTLYKNVLEITSYKTYDEFEKSAENADVVVLDYMYDQQLTQTNGLSLLVKTKMMKPSPVVYMLTGHRHMHIAVQAMKSGASDFIVKGEGCYDRLAENVYQLLKKKSTAQRRESLLSLFSKRMGF